MGCGCDNCVCGKKGQEALAKQNNKMGILIWGIMIIVGFLYFLT